MMPFIVSVDILDDMVFGEFNFRKHNLLILLSKFYSDLLIELSKL